LSVVPLLFASTLCSVAMPPTVAENDRGFGLTSSKGFSLM
jgi:hypothetical protein